jgi:DNA-binding transcriptional regulator YiaG
MTQSSRTQGRGDKLASHQHATGRTLTQRRADLERQIRQAIENDPRMALTDPQQVSQRMKALRERTGLKQYEVAQRINEPPRTFQSWENAEVETDRANYEKVARFYTRILGEKITANWILFGAEQPPAVVAPAATNGSLPADVRNQLERIEAKLDLLLTRLGLQAEDDEGPVGPLPGLEDAGEAPEQPRRARGRSRSRRPKQ